MACSLQPKKENPMSFRIPLALALALVAGFFLWSREEKSPATSPGDAPVKRLDLRVFGQSEFYSASNATLRVVAADFKTDEPLPGADVEISLIEAKSREERSLLRGKTDSRGTLNASFHLPGLPDGKYEIRVEASLGEEKGKVQYPVKLKEAHSIYLTTDKPLYQPAQVMHIRALVLRKFDLKPLAGKKALIEIEDSKGNKVFKREETLSRFGIASTRFTLADEINTGLYTIRVRAEGALEEKKVTVDRYVLPKFKIQCKLDRDFYFPRDAVKGKLDTRYFFGKPVAGGRVEVKASTFDVSFRQFAAWQGKTDGEGRCDFEIQLPDYFVGQPLARGKGLVKLDIEVTDSAGHGEKKTVNTTVSEGSLVLNAFPDGGRIVGGLENTVFVAATYPDGSPASCKLTCKVLSPASREKTIEVRTGELGIGQVRFQAEPGGAPGKKYTLQVSGADDRGNSAEKSFDLAQEPSEDGLLVRPDRSIYEVGQEMGLTILSTRPDGTVYLDIVKDRQTVLTRSFRLAGGRGTFRLDLSPDLFGLLEIHAYQIRKSLNIVGDAARVFVQRADDLSIEIALDREQYLPAEKAVLNFQVKDGEGHPVLAALGLYIVDEAVFGRSELQPGLEKVFFLLEKEIMTPRYQIRGITSDILLGSFPREPDIARRKQDAARILFAAVKPPPRIPVARSSREEEMKQIMLQAREKLWKMIQERAKAKGDWLAADLTPLVGEGYVQADDLLDPWGNAYQRSGCTCNSCRKRYLQLLSSGPDGKRGTADDLLINQGGRITAGGLGDRMAGLGGVRRRMAVRAEAIDEDANGVPVPEARPMAMQPLDELEKVKGQGASPAGPGKSGAGKPAVRIREFFPETLLVEPQLITDERGRARQEVDLADSITSWRLSAFASSPGGALGSTTKPILVFQDFFVDIDFPATLTRNDEVSVPVAVYNYLQKPQTVRLAAEKGSWFEFLEVSEKTVKLEPGEVAAVHFPIRVKELGRRKFTVRAHGSEMQDAVRREVEVVPDGKKFEEVANGRLLEHVEHTFNIPRASIDGSYKILAKFYPGVVCQLLEGMEGLLRLPGG